MYKVRFHLGAGKNFMKWQIISGQSRKYIDPADTSFILYNVKLYNRKSVARKIFNGANKSVCAWMEAEAMEVGPPPDSSSYFEVPVSYNPRVSPNWRDFKNTDIDNQNFNIIMVKGRKLTALVDIR